MAEFGDDSRLLEAFDQLRQTLLSVGLRAESDPRNVNPPAAWITLAEIDHNVTMCGGMDVTFNVLLIVPDAGFEATTINLGNMLAQLLRVIDPDAPTVPTTVQLPGTGAAQPAYRVTVTITI